MVGTDEVALAFTSLPISVIGIAGNFLVCILVLHTKTVKSTFNCLILNLAVSDLLCSVGGMVFQTSVVHRYFSADSADTTKARIAISKTVLAITSISARTSIFTLSAISLDRYYAVVRPLAHRAISASRNAKLGSFIIWLASLVTGIPIFVYLAHLPNECPTESGEKDWFNTILQCSPEGTDVYRYLSALSLVLVHPPTMLLILKTSLAVIKHLWWAQRQNTAPGANTILLQRRKRVTKVMLSVLVSFTVFSMPWMVIQVVAMSSTDIKINNKVFLAAMLSVMAYAAANPVLYTFQSQQFRETIKNLVRRSRKAKDRR